VVTYFVDLRERAMSLETHTPGDGGGLLCRLHADALTVPRGWTLDDRRDPVPRLFRLPDSPTQPADPTPSRGRRRRERLDDGPSLLDETLETPREVPVEPARGEEETRPMPRASGEDETAPIDEVVDEPRELRYVRDEDETWGDAAGDDPWAEEAY